MVIIGSKARNFFCKHKWSIVAFLAVVLLYLIAFMTLPKSVFWSPDEGAKFIQLHVTCGAENSRQPTPYYGRRLDPTYDFFPKAPYALYYPQPLANGQVYCHWPIWFPLISALPFNLLGVTGLYLIPLASGLLTILLVGVLAHQLMPETGPLAMLVVGLATSIFFYSLLFWEYTLVVLLSLVALWQVMQLNQTRNRWSVLLLVSLTLVGAAAMRIEMVVYALALVLAGIYSLTVHHNQQFRLKLAWAIALLIVPVILLVYFGILFESSWLIPTRYRQMVEDVLVAAKGYHLWRAGPDHLRTLWVNTSAELGPVVPKTLTWVGLLVLLLSGVAAIFFPRRTGNWLIIGAATLMGAISTYTLFVGSPFRFIHSIFLPAPFLVLLLLAVPYARSSHRFEVTLVVSTTLLYLVAGTIAAIARTGTGSVIGGAEWGARYTLIIYPLGSLCAVTGLTYFYQHIRGNWSKRLLSGVAALLFFIGVLYQVWGIKELQTTKQTLSAYASTVEKINAPIVTDVWWFPSALAPRFLAQEMYAISRQEDLYLWLNLTATHINSFTFVTFDLPDDKFIQMAPQPLKLKEIQTVYGLIFATFEIARPEVLQ